MPRTCTLKQWTVTDPQGFDTTVAVYNLDTNKKPDPNLFVIKLRARPSRTCSRRRRFGAAPFRCA